MHTPPSCVQQANAAPHLTRVVPHAWRRAFRYKYDTALGKLDKQTYMGFTPSSIFLYAPISRSLAT